MSYSYARTASERDSERFARLEEELLAIQERLDAMVSEVVLSPANIKILAKRGWGKASWGDFSKSPALCSRAATSVGVLWRVLGMGKNLAQLAEGGFEESAPKGS